MDRLYLVTRRDLPAGAQAAQCCHALRAFAELHPDLDRQWHEHGGNIVLLSVGTEAELVQLLEAATAQHISLAFFHEADFGGALTATAFSAAARRLLSGLPLALREFRSAA